MTHCKVKTVEDLEHLIECEELSVVDLAHNKLSDPAIIDVFEKMKNLVSSDLFFKYLFVCMWKLRTQCIHNRKSKKFTKGS